MKLQPVKKYFTFCIVSFALITVFALGSTDQAWSNATVQNPDWEIIITDHGYSDLLFDRRPGFEGREYLSGEWAGAVHYNRGTTAVSPTWFEPNFIFPDWTTNSNFSVTSAIAGTGTFNTDGFEIFESIVSNPDLRVKMRYEMLDTVTGIDQGTTPASDADPGSSITSNRYVLAQTYEIKNISEEVITDLNFFQFLHGLNSLKAMYDNRNYGGTLGTYQYDITQIGTDSLDPLYIHEDVLAFHSDTAPVGWEVGYYGVEGTDSHVTGKPGTGVHLSVEADSLNNTDDFNPGHLWVSGAQEFNLGSLGVNDLITKDVLLSIHTTTTVVPEPISTTLFLIGGATLGFRRFRKRI